MTRTIGQADPLGGTMAWRIQTSGGASGLKMLQNVSTAAIGDTYYTEVWVKNPGAKAVSIYDNIGTAVVVPAGAGWTKVQLLTTCTYIAGVQLLFYAPAAGDALDFYVWHPWSAKNDANLGLPNASWGYVPTEDVAITVDSLGRERVVFYPLSIPPSAAAVTLDAAGRRLWSLCKLVNQPAAVEIPRYSRYAMAFSVRGRPA